MHRHDVLTRTLERERRARKQAEALLEGKSRELYQANEELRTVATALSEQNHRTQAILATAAEGIVTFDERGCIETFNPAAERIFACLASNVIGTNIAELIVSPTTHSTPSASLRHLTSRGEELSRVNEELQGRRSDGTLFPIEVSVSELQLANHLVYTGIFRDITHRKQLETQLAHALKMESVGQLAAGIAHEINTPIQYVGDNTRFLHDAFDELSELLSLYERLEQACVKDKPFDHLLKKIRQTLVEKDLAFVREEIPKALDQTLEGSERVASIVHAMREFSHPGSKERHDVDLNRAIESTLVVTRNEWKYVAELITDLDPNLPPVPCLGDQLNQALLNLIVNAAHAIAHQQSDEKGTITITTQVRGDWVEVQIADTGCGIAEKHRSRIFDPFYTTKPVGKGTGQGLSVVYSVIVEMHQGEIDFFSKEGEGTTFQMRLPLHGVQLTPTEMEDAETNPVC